MNECIQKQTSNTLALVTDEDRSLIKELYKLKKQDG